MIVFLILVTLLSFNFEKDVCNEKVEKLVSKNPYIFEVEIIEVCDRPTAWSESAIFSYQKVKYKIHKVLKGKNVAEEIIVSHAVIEGSPFSDKDVPQLSPSFFYVGRKLILFVEEINLYNKSSKMELSQFIETDSYCSTMPYDEKLLNEIDETIKNSMRLY